MPQIETILVAGIFAAIFLLGHRLQIRRGPWHRAGISASAGAAASYVFVQLLPDLQEASSRFAHAAAGRGWWFAETHVYLVAMAAFVLFYGLDHLVSRWRRETSAEEEVPVPIFAFHVGGFVLYGAAISYMVTRRVGLADGALALYALAMSLHFLCIDHSLFREHPRRYLRWGRYLLVAGVLAGWGAGQLGPIPPTVGCTLLAMVAGGVIVNSMVMELPREKEGRFWPFLAGALVYAGIVLLVIGTRSEGVP